VEQISLMKPKAEDKNETGLLEYLEDIIDTAKYIEPIEQESKKWAAGEAAGCSGLLAAAAGLVAVVQMALTGRCGCRCGAWLLPCAAPPTARCCLCLCPAPAGWRRSTSGGRP
jgi:hypothetical protein